MPRRALSLLAIALGAAILMLLSPAPESSPAEATICGAGQTCYGLSRVKGFDACSAPAASYMYQWWLSSPYYDVGIYIGGANRSCSQPNLTSSWVQTVNGYGWDFYLLWAGRQAQCANEPGFATYISNDPTTAFNQGVAEALAASSAASNLLIHGYKVFYLNLEAYSTTDTTCRNAVKAFVSGWVHELKNILGHRAGVYGTSCNAVDWASAQYVPQNVYLAAWNDDPDVWGLPCLSNNAWKFAQRLHQYSDNVNESWGGYPLLIDRDCAYGLVTPNGHAEVDTTCTTE